jgi:hypothetical protein
VPSGFRTVILSEASADLADAESKEPYSSTAATAVERLPGT